MAEKQPKTVSVNEGLDFLIDTSQAMINFLNSSTNLIGETGLEVKDDAVQVLQNLIDKLQEAKG